MVSQVAEAAPTETEETAPAPTAESPPAADTPASAEAQPLRMSYEEFRAWADEDTHAEWVDGEVQVQMPPKDKHQEIAGFMYMLISLFTNLFKLGVTRFAPLEMRLRWGEESGSAREPDVLFVTEEHRARLTNERLEGPADLVIEVISQGSVARDRADKFYEYQEAGIREYIIIDPRPGKQRIDWYVLTEQGRYQAVLPDDEGRYHAAVLPGFWLREAWLWQEPLPDPLVALMEMPEAASAMRDALGGA